MGILNTILLIIWAVSAIGMIVLVLMHSGKGTGLADVISTQFYGMNTGAGVMEKNLDRLTLICAGVFIATIVIFMFTYPLGTV